MGTPWTSRGWGEREQDDHKPRGIKQPGAEEKSGSRAEKLRVFIRAEVSTSFSAHTSDSGSSLTDSGFPFPSFLLCSLILAVVVTIPDSNQRKR